MASKIRVNYLKDILDLIFPPTCVGCNCLLVGSQELICPSCLLQLPVVEKNLIEDDTFFRITHAMDIKHSDAFLYYWKGNLTQRLIFQLKYHDRNSISHYLAVLYDRKRGEDNIFLKERWDIATIVPLHNKKQKKRGYNQVFQFTSFLSGKHTTYFIPDFLIRKQHLDSQTTKNRDQRLKRLENTYQINHKYKDKAYHSILLIDDVFTTGATLIACTKAVREYYPLAEIGWLFISLSI